MNTIYLVRHGETEWNYTGKYQGQTDVPLNERGILQAQQCSLAMNEITFDKVICSDLSRAYITAKMIVGSRHVDIVKDKRLREINFGAWEALTYKEIDAKWPGALKKCIVILKDYAFKAVKAFKMCKNVHGKH